jgi:hypothetical protein
MASYQRIVSVTDFKFMKLDEKLANDLNAGKTVDAQFKLTAYYVSPEKLQPPNAKQAKPAAKPEEAAPQAK